MGTASLLGPYHRFQLDDYIIALAWSPRQDWLAIAAANGEVQLLQGLECYPLQPAQGYSIDALAFSPGGDYLAAGSQKGEVILWQLPVDGFQADQCHGGGLQPWDVLEGNSTWIDRLAWHPQDNLLAFPQGKTVQVWDLDQASVLAQLQAAGAVQDMAWSPDGNCLAIAAANRVHLWNRHNWDDCRFQWELEAPAMQLAWSIDSRYLATSIRDNSIGILDWAQLRRLGRAPQTKAELPSLMRGFPAKIRQLAWLLPPKSSAAAPLLAAPSRELITMWMEDDNIGWESWALEFHLGKVLDIAFQPGTGILASIAEDGHICLWHLALDPIQVMDRHPPGWSCLSWSAQGQYLAVGGQDGEVQIWAIYGEAGSHGQSRALKQKIDLDKYDRPNDFDS